MEDRYLDLENSHMDEQEAVERGLQCPNCEHRRHTGAQCSGHYGSGPLRGSVCSCDGK